MKAHLHEDELAWYIDLPLIGERKVPGCEKKPTFDHAPARGRVSRTQSGKL
jgi:hypothetical protein